ncbi:MAG TPA: DUF3306 domain-containing protein [Pseudolabrys sp.]|nr:DUF3306 domain-containing protein [Pseudolabrys sp.]
MSGDGNRLSRWSQRKAAARRGETLPEPDEAQLTAPDAAEAAVEPEQNPLPDEAAAADDIPALPPVEDLTFESDFSAFLHDKVPEALRRAALRKLWTSDPVLANLDGLNDYCEDYHAVDTTISAAQTAYRVGRGYLDDVEEKLAQVGGVLGEAPAADSEFGAPGAERPAALSKSDAAGDKDAGASRQAASDAAGAEPAQPPQARDG